MSSEKILYTKPKSFIRKLLQKLFLKILLKFFPKKFSSYKNKIRNLLNKFGFHLPLTLSAIYLKFKHPRYFKVPSRQICAFEQLIKFSEVLKKNKIDFFLLCGTLLGAMRQESFAGRPSDIDLGIKEEQVPKLLDAIPLLIKNGGRIIKEVGGDNFNNLLIVCRYILVDITIYRKKKIGEKEMWIGEGEDPATKFVASTFQIKDLENLIPVNFFEKQFMAPANPEIYLEKRYGKNWKIPDKSQFFWNKNKFKQESNN